MSSIFYQEEYIVALEASERAKRGLPSAPERRRIFSESSALENLKIGAYLATRT